MRLRLRHLASRGALGYMVMGLIVACGAAWSFGALVEIGNIATERARLTTLPPPYAGYLFAGSVDLFIFYGYLKCYGPPWQIVLAVFHILAGLVTSVWLQYQHSKGTVDPVLVSVIPPLAVAVSLDTWVVSQMADWYRRSKARPAWEPVPTPTVPAPAGAASGAGTGAGCGTAGISHAGRHNHTRHSNENNTASGDQAASHSPPAGA